MTAALICATLGLNGLAHASPPAFRSQNGPVGAQLQRSPGLTWTLLQSSPRGWAEGQPITLLLGLGPSNPRYGGLRGSRSLVVSAAPSVPSTTAALGWTRPLGMRLAIRW